MAEQVLVRSGDSLWTIAARELGAHPDAARIAAAWPRLYAANRNVIGADPNLLRTGEHLIVPTSIEGK
jgi:nucleoid-associated protein YgaU